MATDRISWELTADPVPIERAFERAGLAADKAYDRASTAINKETGLINTLAIRLDRLRLARDKAHDPKQIQRINTLINEQSTRLNQLTGNVTKLGNEMGKTTQKASFLGGQIDQLGSMIAGAFAIQGIIAFTQNVVRASVALEGMERQLKAITGTEAQAAAEMDYLRAISEQYGLNLQETTKAYISFAGATTRSGMSMAQTRDIFESVSMATTVMGLSTEQSQGAFLALQQMVSKSTVSAEELRGQLGERIPGAFSLATEAARRMTGNLDLTEQQFGKMMEQGRVLAKDLLPELAKVFKETFEKDVAESAEGGAAALNRMSTAFFNLLTNVGNTAPITGAVNAITALTDAVARGVSVLSKGTTETYLNDKKLEQTLQAQTVIKKLNAQLDKQGLTDAEKKIKIDKLLADGLKKEQELLLERAKVRKETERGGASYESKRRLFDLYEIVQGQQVYNELLKSESSLLVQNTDAGQENTKQTEKELEILKRINAEREKGQKAFSEWIQDRPKREAELNTTPQIPDWAKDMGKTREQLAEEQARLGNEQIETQRLIDAEFERLDKDKTEKEKKEAEKRKEIAEKEREIKLQQAQLIGESAIELTGLLSNAYQAQTIDLQRQLDQGLITQENYEARLRQIKRKEFEVDRLASLAKIAINTAVQASAATPLLAPFVIAAGAAQAIVVATRPNPYAKGTKRVTGGEKGKDSVLYDSPTGLSALMPDEMIMPAKKTIAHAPYLDNVFDGRISPTQSRWAAGLFVNQTIEPGLLKYMASISGGGGYSDSRQIGQLVRAITKKKSPDFNKPADRIVRAIYNTSNTNSFSSWRKYKK